MKDFENKEALIERLAETSEKVFDNFKTAMLEKSKEELFAGNYIIRFYEEMNVFFTECGSKVLNEHTLKVLVALGEYLLGTLYDEYIRNEYASINNWDSICEWLDEYARHIEGD